MKKRLVIRMSLDLASQLATALSNFNEDVQKEIESALDEVADEAVEELKANSPRKTGDYAGDWAVKKDKKNKRVIYQPNEYRLAHLLEFGHVKRNGGRVSGTEHIKPIEEKVIKGIEEAFIQKLGG